MSTNKIGDALGPLKVGDTLPEATFMTVPYTAELADHSACGRPAPLKTSDWANKKVVLFSVPGAFTPTCHQEHLPGFVKNLDQFKAKGADVVAVVAANDPFVMSGWARVNQLDDKIIALSDTNAEWSAKNGLALDLSKMGLGTRTGRYAMVIDNLVVKYIGLEEGPGVTVSGADAVLAAL